MGGSVALKRGDCLVMRADGNADRGFVSREVIQTAQSQWHDHLPAREVGIKSAWIDRRGATMGNVKPEDEVWD